MRTLMISVDVTLETLKKNNTKSSTHPLEQHTQDA